MGIRGPGAVQCKRCLAVARTLASLGKGLCSPCEPTSQERLKAQNDAGLQRAPPMRSQALQVALEAADRLFVQTVGLVEPLVRILPRSTHTVSAVLVDAAEIEKGRPAAR